MTDTPPEDRPKVSHWDRPKPPHDWRWVVGGFGRTLITLGLLMFGFVAYQLWGTGIQTAQAQRELSSEFNKLVGGAGTTTTTIATSVPTTTPTATSNPATAPTTTAVGSIAPTTTTTPAGPSAKPIPAEGEAVARIEIPKIGLNRIVVEGAAAGDLAKGPGHFPETPLPGQLGNAAIAAHRTTHLAPFYDIDQLQPGDEIDITTLNGRYVYHVTGSEVVSPDDYAAVIPTTDPTKATLTLVSCTPRYSSTNRIIVHAELVASESDPLTVAAPVVPGAQGPAATLPDEGSAPSTTATTVAASVDATAPTATSPVTATTTPVSATVPSATGASPSSPDAFADGWFADSSAIPQALFWGLLVAAVAYGVLWLSRKVRRYWVGILAGFVPFLVVLYFFYENVNRLLPPNL